MFHLWNVSSEHEGAVVNMMENLIYLFLLLLFFYICLCAEPRAIRVGWGGCDGSDGSC